MAGEWIKMRGNLWDDPRVSRLCDLTDESEAAIVGALYWLWSSADSHTEDGLMPGLSLKGLDRKSGVKGFAESLVTVGWIEETENGITIIRFSEHNGKSAKRRASEAKRKGEFRKESDSDTQVGGKASASDADKLQEVAELEKRREEKNKTTKPEQAPACPYSDIVDLYHSKLPQLPQVRQLTDKRKAQIKQRWREDSKRQNLEWWSSYFEYVQESDFLCGRVDPTPGRTLFLADLEWITTQSKFVNVIEGKYENGGRANA